jgi:hypothetical protein
MALRILVLVAIAGLCLIAASPRNHDIDGDGYGPQMVTEVPLPRASSYTGNRSTVVVPNMAITNTYPVCLSNYSSGANVVTTTAASATTMNVCQMSGSQ